MAKGDPQSWDQTSSLLWRYGVAVAAVGLALLLTWLLRPFLEQPAFSLFFAAVMLSAWYGGLGPGGLATGLAVLTINLFLLSHSGTPAMNLRSALQLVVFGLVALLISSLTGARKRAENRLRQAHSELETRVQERTAELTKQNAALLRLERELSRVEPLAALGRITATMAHELGTPLNTVLGYSQLLAQETLSDSAREQAQIIEAEIHRMTDIIRSYLSQTRSPPREYTQVNINELIAETLSLLKPLFQHHGIGVTATLTETLPPLTAEREALIFLPTGEEAPAFLPKERL